MTHPGPHRQAKSRGVSGRHQPRSVPRELVELSRKLAKVKAQARALGIFTDDRELLACPNCGLLEDVTADGLLVTYLKTYPIPVPSLNEQREIAGVFAALDRKEKVHGRKHAALTALFRTLLHQLMTAQLRVHNLELPELEAMQ